MGNYYYSKRLINIFRNNEEIISLILSLSILKNHFVVRPENIRIIFDNSTNRIKMKDSIISGINSTHQQVLKLVRELRPKMIMNLLDNFINDLSLLDEFYGKNNSLIKNLNEFSEIHTDVYSEKDIGNAYKITVLSSEAIKIIQTLEERAMFKISTFEKKGKLIPEGYSVLNISTDKDIPIMGDYLRTLGNIEELYKYVCKIYKIDPKENQLIINYIGTGSWFTELFGIKQVVITIENIIKGLGCFIRDLITGKISRERFENKCKKIEACINVMTKAKKNGIDNAELGLSKKLKPIIDGFLKDTTIIEINGEEILELKENEKLTLIERRSERSKILEKINLSIEDKVKK